MESKEYRHSIDEMIDMIKDYLKHHPDNMQYRDHENPYYKEGYRKALEDFLYIAS